MRIFLNSSFGGGYIENVTGQQRGCKLIDRNVLVSNDHRQPVAAHKRVCKEQVTLYRAIIEFFQTGEFYHSLDCWKVHVIQSNVSSEFPVVNYILFLFVQHPIVSFQAAAEAEGITYGIRAASAQIKKELEQSPPKHAGDEMKYSRFRKGSGKIREGAHDQVTAAAAAAKKSKMRMMLILNLDKLMQKQKFLCILTATK